MSIATLCPAGTLGTQRQGFPASTRFLGVAQPNTTFLGLKDLRISTPKENEKTPLFSSVDRLLPAQLSLALRVQQEAREIFLQRVFLFVMQTLFFW